MTQTAVPVADIEAGAFSPEPLYSNINDAFIESDDLDVGEQDEFEVQLNSLQPPDPSGSHVLEVQLKVDTLDVLDVQVELRDEEEGTTIGTWSLFSEELTTSWKTFQFTLTQAQVDSIDGWLALQFHLLVVYPED